MEKLRFTGSRPVRPGGMDTGNVLVGMSRALPGPDAAVRPVIFPGDFNFHRLVTCV